MKYKDEKLAKAKRTIARVEACTISVDHAIKVAQSIGGTVFDVRLKEVDEQVVWRVKILRNNKQTEVYVHGNTGHLLEVKPEPAVIDSRSGITPEIFPTPSLSN